ncbi:helix-turn-helix transcriptional regulator [Chitinilyticum litopenaei]|uniref:helix-turn-helix transcriptional regulator n=1 Tax=Chitinilyticum litopenaei TaxID=1121276 RepID=UPI0003FF3F74|nr:helix-turn-helix transcriptional regulator [Chitinilyticum litopenaei]
MSTRQQELADFLKAVRLRADPAAFGFAGSARRRTTGLRREEVAQLAGISPTWYTWIEQAREVSMSVAVLDRLANALRMDPMQRGYLFELAGKLDPQPHHPESRLDQAIMQQLVDAIATPSYLLGPYWDVLAWNAAAAGLFGHWPRSGEPLNLLEYVFFAEDARQLIVDWDNRCQRLVAEFRADSRAMLDDPHFLALLARMEASERFRTYWHQHDVLDRQGGLRRFQHPQHGELAYLQCSFALTQQQALKLVMLLQAE